MQKIKKYVLKNRLLPKFCNTESQVRSACSINKFYFKGFNTIRMFVLLTISSCLKNR